MDPPDRLRGSVLGLASALLFGLGAPVSKLLLPGTQPLVLAALLYLGAGLAFLLAWEWGVASKLLDKFFFSRPSDVLTRVWQWISTGSIWGHLAVTLTEALLSFAILGLGSVLLYRSTAK